MGTKDAVTKKYMSDSKRFADVFNYYVYGGKQVIKSENLTEMDPTEIAILPMLKKVFSKQKFRDVLKRCMVKTGDKVVYVLFGVENQSDIHYAMCVKNLLYDALNYAGQIDSKVKEHHDKKDLDGDEFLSGFSKEDTVIPVVTLTIYWGKEKWDGCIKLSDMFPRNTPKEIRALATDYKLNLLTPDNITDYKLFHTDIGDVMELIKRSDEPDALEKMAEERNGQWKLENESVLVLNSVINAGIMVNTQKGYVDMCKATSSLIEKGRMQGLIEGRVEGREEGREEGRVEESERVSKLYLYLLNSGKNEEMKKAMEDTDYRNALLKKLEM